MKSIKVLIAICIAFSLYSCKKDSARALTLATTTSTDNTGLLDYLKPALKAQTGIELKWIAVGTGKALEMGKNCDVDALLVHAPEAEKEFLTKGYGSIRMEIMYNDFILVGPAEDKGMIKSKNITDAFKIIASKKITFISRGDNSGTHKKELSLWEEAGIIIPEKAGWYIETGQGMIRTIHIASERKGYTLADRGTYIKYSSTLKDKPPMIIIIEGDKSLRNQYSVMSLNPVRCSNIKQELALQFIKWMSSPETQKFIGDYKLLGKQLFIPNAEK